MKLFLYLKRVAGFVFYYLRSTNRHGLQAPFIYNLNEAVLRHDKIIPVYRRIENRRQELLSDDRLLTISDYGAGSALTVKAVRKVSSITRSSSKQARYARVLHRLVNYLQPATMLEFGTAAGISALYQVSGNPSGKLITLEGSVDLASLAKESFQQFPELAIELVTGEFSESLPPLLSSIEKLDYVFIDGNHRLDPVIGYFNAVFPKLHDDSVVIIDDINWSGEMQLAWKTLITDNRVKLSVNIYQMGFLFFNRGLSKQDFIIRY